MIEKCEESMHGEAGVIGGDCSDSGNWTGRYNDGMGACEHLACLTAAHPSCSEALSGSASLLHLLAAFL